MPVPVSDLGAVVVHHHVLLAEHHTLNPGDELACRLAQVGIGSRDEHRLRIAEGVTEGDQSMLTQVRPEPTTSAMASATPSWMEISTAPSRRMISASIPRSARSRRTRFGYEVAMRFPARSPTVHCAPAGRRSGTSMNRSHRICSSTKAPESPARSRPVIPRSRCPDRRRWRCLWAAGRKNSTSLVLSRTVRSLLSERFR